MGLYKKYTSPGATFGAVITLKEKEKNARARAAAREVAFNKGVPSSTHIPTFSTLIPIPLPTTATPTSPSITLILIFVFS